MPQLTEEQRFAISVYESITSLFDEDSENYQYDINSIDLTKFFTGIIIANNMFYQKVTAKEGDLFDFIAVQMKLAHQYATKSEEDDNE